MAKLFAAATAPDSREAMRSLGVVSTGLARAIAAERPDVVHLHWVGGEIASLGELAGLAPPVVWTPHDCWPFAGANHWGNLIRNEADPRP